MPGPDCRTEAETQYDRFVERLCGRGNIYLFLSEHRIDFSLRIFDKTKYRNLVLQTPYKTISQSRREYSHMNKVGQTRGDVIKQVCAAACICKKKKKIQGPVHLFSLAIVYSSALGKCFLLRIIFPF